MATKDHVDDTGPQGICEHEGTDGSAPDDRMKRYVHKFNTLNAENLAFEKNSQGLAVILSLFIDDGVKDRGHRVNMQNPSFVYMGSYTGPHKVYQGMTAINYAGPL